MGLDKLNLGFARALLRIESWLAGGAVISRRSGSGATASPEAASRRGALELMDKRIVWVLVPYSLPFLYCFTLRRTYSGQSMIVVQVAYSVIIHILQLYNTIAETYLSIP
jgi:hypothetical protein